MKTLLISISLVVVSIIVTSCGNDSASTKTSPNVPQKDPIHVSTQKAGSQLSNNSIVLSGKIQAKEKATVSARMMGYVNSLNIDIGDRVSAGQTILTIKNTELPAKRNQVNASINEANAALQNVKINYDRMKALWEQESITRKEWDDISAQYEMMKAKVERAQSMRTEIEEVMAYTNVTAPISGVVTDKMINRGDLVNPGIPLMVIEGNQGYEVATNVSDDQISQIKKGMALEVEIKSLGKVVNAIVSEISPSAINTGGQFGIKANLKLDRADQNKVYPGMYANVYAQLPSATRSSKNSSMTIHKTALVERGQLVGLYTISNQNTALLRWVRTGKDYGSEIEIVSGLSEGEEYITTNIDQLIDGTPVSK